MQRPKRGIAEAVVVKLELLGRQFNGDVANALLLDVLGLGGGRLARRAAPAEPNTARLAQRREQTNRQAARGCRVTRNRDAVGHRHQAAHRASSQERESRMAQLRSDWRSAESRPTARPPEDVA